MTATRLSLLTAWALLWAAVASSGPADVDKGQPELNQPLDNFPFRWNQLIHANPSIKSEKDYPKMLTQRTMDLLSEAVNMLTHTSDQESKQWLEAFVFKIGQLAVELEENDKKKKEFIIEPKNDKETQPTMEAPGPSENPTKHQLSSIPLVDQFEDGKELTAAQNMVSTLSEDDDLVQQLHEQGHEEEKTQTPKIRVVVYHHPTLSKKTTSRKLINPKEEISEANIRDIKNHGRIDKHVLDTSYADQLVFQKQRPKVEIKNIHDQAMQENPNIYNNDDLTAYLSGSPLKFQQNITLPTMHKSQDSPLQKQSVTLPLKYLQDTQEKPQINYKALFAAHKIQPHESSASQMKFAENSNPHKTNKLNNYLFSDGDELPYKHSYEDQTHSSPKHHFLEDEQWDISQYTDDNTEKSSVNKVQKTGNNTHTQIVDPVGKLYEEFKGKIVDNTRNSHYSNPTFYAEELPRKHAYSTQKVNEQSKGKKETEIKNISLQNKNGYPGFPRPFQLSNELHENIERQLRAGKVIILSDSVVRANFEKTPKKQMEIGANTDIQKSTDNTSHT